MNDKTIQYIQIISAVTTVALGVIQITQYLKERKKLKNGTGKQSQERSR